MVVTRFEVGDVVEIRPPEAEYARWYGLRATVLVEAEDPEEGPDLRALGRRPDGVACDFYWPSRDLVLVDEST